MPKSHKSRPNQINKLIMEQNSVSNPFTGLHKQKLYALIIAAAGIVFCLLPWWHVSFGGYGGYSINGLHRLGIITFIGFLAVGGVTFFMGDKSKPYEGQEKMIAAACFGGAAAFGIITLLANMHYLSFGIFLAIAAGVIGALYVWGMVKIPENKKPSPPAQ